MKTRTVIPAASAQAIIVELCFLMLFDLMCRNLKIMSSSKFEIPCAGRRHAFLSGRKGEEPE